MRKIYLLIGLFMVFCNVIAQKKSEDNNTKSPFWQKVQFGGGINLGFTGNVSNFGLSPSAIYNFNDKFSSGLGVSYLYSKIKTTSNTNTYHVYGGSLIGLYKPVNMLQLSAEFEENIIDQSGLDARNHESLFLGAGYTVGRNGAIGLRYDLLYDQDKSFYGSALVPFIRIYF